MDNKRINQLEHTVLELGTEMYRLKSELAELLDFKDKFVGTMVGLKRILDDKGLISLEDFDSAVDLGEALGAISTHSEGVELDLEFLKKTSH